MRRFGWGALALSGAVALALAGTLLVPTLGLPLWHHNVAFLVLLVALAAAWTPLQRRRVATLAMAGSGILATATGFAMLYTVQFAYKEWITWWHTVTSVALLLTFLAHWLHNNPRLGIFTKRLLTRERAFGLAVVAAWVAVVVLFAWTWFTDARGAFTAENYLYVASWTAWVGVAVPYGLWLAHRPPAMRARLGDPAERNRARALVDTSLFLAHWGALLTGFALLWFAETLRSGDLKYVSKWWHTATSVAFLGLVALHVGFNARPLAAHARRVDDELRRR